ncbi:SDR family oxidoreductase [Sphingomonas crocodyli]|uniref:SDR family oxidoreductase n=1 Tax=Sphingomonas crocodyli TaxID=1979270 RepID=A0A437M801_9SPHN|nr:SDR family oxidoreductase [Sphingomonas crocodyli]RVT93624.1 SDR family oxidoreductase [Sphingomonas crocodyli]
MEDAKHIALFGAGPVASELAEGLEAGGARVTVIDPSAAYDLAALGPVDALIWAWIDPRAGKPARIHKMSADHWAAIAEEPLHHILAFFKAGYHALRERGGAVILIEPSLAMTGAAGLVAWATVAEGQRSIAKAVARKWGPLGITVNSLAVPGALLAGAGDADLERPGLPAMSLAAPDLRHSIAPLIASLLTPAWRSVTGTTISADGGRWMTP